MEGYQTYEEFLDELISWGDTAVQEHPKGWDTVAVFQMMWKRSEQGAGQGVFSPFLYLALSAGLMKAEAILLAAALYLGLKSGEGKPKALTCSFWKQFLG